MLCQVIYHRLSGCVIICLPFLTNTDTNFEKKLKFALKKDEKTLNNFVSLESNDHYNKKYSVIHVKMTYIACFVQFPKIASNLLESKEIMSIIESKKKCMSTTALLDNNDNNWNLYSAISIHLILMVITFLRVGVHE